MSSVGDADDARGFCSSGLLTNEVIRAFLARYEVVQWPEAILLATLQGVLCFEDVFGRETTPLRTLRSAIEQKMWDPETHRACGSQGNTHHIPSVRGTGNRESRSTDKVILKL